MLIVDNKIKNLGSVKFGQPQEFTYKITNTYPGKVNIEKLIIGCTSCTKAEISTWDMDSEEVATVSVVFTPGSTGLQSKKITIIYSTGAIERPPIELLIKAQVNE